MLFILYLILPFKDVSDKYNKSKAKTNTLELEQVKT